MELQPLDSKWIRALISAILLSSPAIHAEIYQWTDADGNVHFSDEVPTRHRDDASQVKLSGKVPDEAEVEAANARAERIRNALKSTSESNLGREDAPEEQQEATSEPANAKTPESPPLSASATPAERRARYEQAMERYRKALDCFGPYKNRNGSTKVEALEKCPIIPRPRESDY